MSIIWYYRGTVRIIERYKKMTKIKIGKNSRRALFIVVTTLFFLLIAALFFRQIVVFVILCILLVVASISKIYKRFTSISVGFELITPITVLLAYKLGIGIAIVCSAIMLLSSSFISGKMNFVVDFTEFGIYVILSIISATLSGASFTSLAIAMILLRNILLFPIGVFLLGRNFVQLFIVVMSNAFFNILIVQSIGNGIVGLI